MIADFPMERQIRTRRFPISLLGAHAKPPMPMRREAPAVAELSSGYSFCSAAVPGAGPDPVGLADCRIRESVDSKVEKLNCVGASGGLSALAAAVGEAAGDVLSVADDTNGDVAAGPGCRGGLGGVAVSTLPRMIGNPSLPPPTMTILAFVDCESASVASMPRQRR